MLAHEADFDKKIRAKYSAPFLDMHRVDLQLALYARAQELGVRFRLGEPVEALDLDAATAEVTTQAGARARADLIVAADGVWSRCQACYLGDRARPPLPTGDLAYRIVLDLAQAAADPELAALISRPAVHFWVGPGAHAVGYSMRAGNMYNLVLLVPDDLPDNVSRQPGNVEEMKTIFADWDPILRRVLDKVEKVEKWRLMHSMWNHALPPSTLGYPHVVSGGLTQSAPYCRGRAGFLGQRQVQFRLCVSPTQKDF